CLFQRTEIYDPKTFIIHATSLRQTCDHCGSISIASSRRSLGRVSVRSWPFSLTGRLRIVTLVSFYPTNYLMRHRSICKRHPRQSFILLPGGKRFYLVLARVSTSYPKLVGRLPTCYSPIRRSIHSLPPEGFR